MPTCPYGESVNVCVPYMYPSVCVWSDVISLVGNRAAGVMVRMCVSRIRRQVDTLSETPGMESARPQENHTLWVPPTQKPLSLTTITEWQQPAQHNTHRQQQKRDSREGRRKRENEAEREIERNPVCRKVHRQRAQIRGTTNYTQLDHELNFKEIIGLYLCQTKCVAYCNWMISLPVMGMCCSYLHKIRVNK